MPLLRFLSLYFCSLEARTDQLENMLKHLEKCQI